MHASTSFDLRRHLGLLLPVALAALVAGADPGASQVHRFGKNKVQYADFQWQKTETDHFDLYFYAEEEELAGYAAEMAERGFADLERKFAHTVQRRIPLIIYSSHVYFEQTNIIPDLLPPGVAGFTEFLKGRVVLPLSGSLPEFERVLRHELVHVFMADRIKQVLGRRGITDFRPAPLWFSEGLAEYWSGEWDTYADMIIRDSLFSRRLVAIDGMHFIHGTFQLYKEGQSICAHMAATYGEDIFALLLDNWWRGRDFAEVFEKVTGDSLAKLDKDWQYRLGKEYLPDIAAADPPSRLARPLTRRGFNVKPQVFAAGDSAGVIFFRNYQGYTQIVRSSLQGGDDVVVVEGERSPSFEALHALDTKPAVSADGRRLAFSAKRAGRDHLYIWDLCQGREERRFSFDEVVAISSPSWSPDGRRLVFSGAHKGGIADLYVVDTVDGSLQALTSDIYHDRDPDWSADGSRIAFSSDRWEGGRRGFYNLFLYEVEERQVLPLTRGWHNDLQPAWSPGGQSLVFSSDRDTMFNLYAMRLSRAPEGGLRAATRRVTRTLTGTFDPVWTPDRRGLLFSGYEDGRFQIYHQELGRDDSAAVAWESLPSAKAATWKPEAALGGPLARKKYRKKMSLDIAQSQISQDLDFGTSGGIQVGMSDMLGNDHYYLVLSHISGNVDVLNGLNMVLGRQHLGRQLNTTWGVFRLNDRLSGRFGRRVREKRVGASIDLSYPFSRFDRVETGLSLRHASIDRQSGGGRLKGWLVTNALSYTHDSSIWTITGPLEGKRYSFGAAQTVDFKRSRRFNVTLFGDYRHYFRLSRRSALALRLMGRHSSGDVPEFFPLGGSWTLRGYGWRSIWGSKALLLNNELRFPLLDRLVIGLPVGNIDLSAFRGALFVDAGNAWTGEFGGWKGSLGAGVRLALGGIFVFRLDAARRTDFESLGNDTRWDFFFGWDY